MATKRARVHSRDLQPQIAAPKALFAAARVQRFDWPMNLPTESIDELGRKLHVGTTTDIPDVTVTFEAFDVSHNTFAYLTGYTPATFPSAGVSITELKNVDVIGQIRDTSTLNIVNALYVKRGIVTGIDASFGVRDNSTVSYTVSSNSKKEFKQPVYYQQFTLVSGLGSSTSTLTNTPSYLTRTSGYTINAYRTGTDGSTGYLNEGAGLDYTIAGAVITWIYPQQFPSTQDTVWVTYSAPVNKAFEGLNDADPSAIQGKYVPLTISVSNIPRVQSATVRVAFESEGIFEMGGLGKPVGYEVGIPQVTGDISVLKTDNDLLNLIQSQASTTVESDMEFAATTLPLKIQLKDPRNPARVQLTYYVPSITFTAEGDDSTVNASMNETLSWQSTTGELFIASGTGPW
jgi:hypothetical protein